MTVFVNYPVCSLCGISCWTVYSCERRLATLKRLSGAISELMLCTACFRLSAIGDWSTINTRRVAYVGSPLNPTALAHLWAEIVEVNRITLYDYGVGAE